MRTICQTSETNNRYFVAFNICADGTKCHKRKHLLILSATNKNRMGWQIRTRKPLYLFSINPDKAKTISKGTSPVVPELMGGSAGASKPLNITERLFLFTPNITSTIHTKIKSAE